MVLGVRSLLGNALRALNSTERSICYEAYNIIKARNKYYSCRKDEACEKKGGISFSLKGRRERERERDPTRKSSLLKSHASVMLLFSSQKPSQELGNAFSFSNFKFKLIL